MIWTSSHTCITLFLPNPFPNPSQKPANSRLQPLQSESAVTHMCKQGGTEQRWAPQLTGHLSYTFKRALTRFHARLVVGHSRSFSSGTLKVTSARLSVAPRRRSCREDKRCASSAIRLILSYGSISCKVADFNFSFTSFVVIARCARRWKESRYILRESEVSMPLHMNAANVDALLYEMRAACLDMESMQSFQIVQL